MKNSKTQKAYFVFMVFMSVLMTSSLVYGDSGKPGEAETSAVLDDAVGMNSQGIVTLVNGMSGTATVSTLVAGFHATGAAFTVTPASVRTEIGKIRTDKVHSATDECKESCSLN